MCKRSTFRILVLALVVAGLVAPPAPVAGADPPVGAGTSTGSGVLAVSAGFYHTCAIRTDGTIGCWGESDSGAATPPGGTFSAVSAGTEHTCGLRTDGTIACWGDDSSGQASPPAGTFDAVSAGDEHTCGLRTDGTIACWGWNEAGEASPPAKLFKAVSAGAFYTCGIRANDTLDCWGDNTYRQAKPPRGAFTAVSAGFDHACALRTDGTLACWGNDYAVDPTPTTGTFLAVSAGANHSCAIKDDGALACWGDNEDGQLAAPSGTFVAISAGAFHTCAIRTDTTLACWGWNEFDQLTPRPTAAVKGLPTWLATTSVPLSWSARAAIAPVISYDVRYRRARWNGSFGDRVTWRSATTATSATFTASPGSTYCFAIRARDVDGGVSAWTAGTCTAIPLDDRSLTRHGTWTAGTGAAYYRSTYLRSSTYGARLTRTGVVARRIALLATTCPTCGTVKVYWGATLLDTVSLHSDTTVNRKLITVKTFTSARTGTLTIKVVSSGRKVIIDGIAIRRN